MEVSTIEELDELFRDENGNTFPIPVGGSLGLLAIGDLGIQAWRLKIQLTKQNLQSLQNTNQ